MPDQEPSQLGRKIAVASFFMIALRFAFRGIGFISTLILVRLLSPADFGLVGLATAVFSVFDALTETSMQMALIRLPQMDRTHLDTAWTFGIIRGLLIGGILAASAPLAADWMNDTRVHPILLVLAATAALQGFENIGMVTFRRDLKFRKIFEFGLWGKLVSFSVTIPLAIMFRSYWALVAGIVAGRLFTCANSYTMHPYRPRLSLAAWRDLLSFSKWLLINNVLGVIEAYTATLLFSRIGGPRAVGLYQVAWQVGSLPTGEVFAPVREPIYAGYSRLLGNLSAMRRHFVDSLALVLMVICPMSIGLGLTADLACNLMLGSQWSDATTLIRLCAFYALFDSIGHFTHSIYIVLNKQRRLVSTYAPIVVLRFGLAIWVGLHWGVAAAVWSLMVTAGISSVIWLWGVFPLLRLDLIDLLRPIWRTIAATALMSTIMLAWLPLEADHLAFHDLLLRTAVAVGAGAAIQAIAQTVLWLACDRPDGPERRAQQFFAALLRRLTAAIAVRRGVELR